MCLEVNTAQESLLTNQKICRGRTFSETRNGGTNLVLEPDLLGKDRFGIVSLTFCDVVGIPSDDPRESHLLTVSLHSDFRRGLHLQLSQRPDSRSFVHRLSSSRGLKPTT
jgi:hypothetical protein